MENREELLAVLAVMEDMTVELEEWSAYNQDSYAELISQIRFNILLMKGDVKSTMMLEEERSK